MSSRSVAGTAAMSPDLSVVICSLDGEEGITRCLDAVEAQTIRRRLEVVVVDDGSTDGTGRVAGMYDTIVVRHETNRGLAAARNTGICASRAPIVAFLDDDCEPDPHWAEELLAAYDNNITGIGGPIIPGLSSGLVASYLERHNPLQPLELELAQSERLPYRLGVYLRSKWMPEQRTGIRDVFSFAGANMSFRRNALVTAGGFDERFSFGAEETDLCRRLVMSARSARLVYIPQAWVTHHFEPTIQDMLRRSRSYGRGGARLYRKWPSLPPTFLPSPVLVLVALAISIRLPWLLFLSAAIPLLLYPQGLMTAIKHRHLSYLLDPYFELLQETSHDVGFVIGLWEFRHLTPQVTADSEVVGDSYSQAG